MASNHPGSAIDSGVALRDAPSALLPAQRPLPDDSLAGLTLPELPGLPEPSAAPATPPSPPAELLTVEPFAEPAVEPFAEPAAELFVEPATELFAEPAAEPFAGTPPPHDPGELLRSRILDQVHRAEAAEAALHAAARAKALAAQKVREAVARRKAEEDARRQAAAEADEAAERAAAQATADAERERLARLATGYLRPVSCYTLGDRFGGAGSPWASVSAGQDFAAPAGTPVAAVHTGTIVAAGWAGAFGYRLVLTLDDGTQVWYCHLSSLVRTVGRVTTGDVIGRVGATGNAPSPMLHLEVRPGGGEPVDPLGWLAQHGVAV